jgi:hypothetical protein
MRTAIGAMRRNPFILSMSENLNTWGGYLITDCEKKAYNSGSQQKSANINETNNNRSTAVVNTNLPISTKRTITAQQRWSTQIYQHQRRGPLCVFIDLRWEVIASFADIGRIVVTTPVERLLFVSLILVDLCWPPL